VCPHMGSNLEYLVAECGSEKRHAAQTREERSELAGSVNADTIWSLGRSGVNKQ
jgi:hypothetical protein